MKNLIYLILGSCLVLITSCNSASPKLKAQALLKSTADQKIVGTMDFYELPNGEVKMDLELNYPMRADSSVAVHIHEHGDCGNNGDNAHGHWNPTSENHGQWGIGSYHSGDIGNIALNEKGYAKYSIMSNRWSLNPEDANFIGNLGVIMHGGVDDYTTQPTGNSGSRIGCGIIELR